MKIHNIGKRVFCRISHVWEKNFPCFCGAVNNIVLSLFLSLSNAFPQFNKGVKGEAQAVEGEERYFLLTKGCSTNLAMIIVTMFKVKAMTMMWINTNLAMMIVVS